MRLGGKVYRWSTAEEWAQRHVEKGYGAAIWPLAHDSSALDEAQFIQAAKRHGIVIAQVGVWKNLFDPNVEAAAANVAFSIAKMKQADRIGARCCVNISGSCSTVWDGPHPENLTKKTFDRIVSLTQYMLDETKLTNTYYALQPMPWMYPTDAATTKALLEAVNRPEFAVHVDMVNMINSPEKIFRTGELVKEYFTTFKKQIRSVHVKDISIDDSLTIHMPEVVCGEGFFDLRTLLQETAALDDMPILVEHLHDEATYDKAVSHLHKLADELNLHFDTAY